MPRTGERGSAQEQVIEFFLCLCSFAKGRMGMCMISRACWEFGNEQICWNYFRNGFDWHVLYPASVLGIRGWHFCNYSLYYHLCELWGCHSLWMHTVCRIVQCSFWKLTLLFFLVCVCVCVCLLFHICRQPVHLSHRWCPILQKARQVAKLQKLLSVSEGPSIEKFRNHRRQTNRHQNAPPGDVLRSGSKGTALFRFKYHPGS